MKYQPKTEYLKKKIDDLLFLEKYITEGVHGFAGNMKAHNLKSEYKEDYEMISMEAGLSKKNIEELLDVLRETEENIKRLVWMYKYPDEPYEGQSFPYKKILREEFNLVI